MKISVQKSFIGLLWSMCLLGTLSAQQLSPATRLKATSSLTEYILVTCHHSNPLPTRVIRIYRSEFAEFSTAAPIVKAQHDLKFFDKDKSLKPNVWYYYWILEINPVTGEESSVSEKVKGRIVRVLDGERADIKLLPPTDITAMDAGNAIQLEWCCLSYVTKGMIYTEHLGYLGAVSTERGMVSISYLILRSLSPNVNQSTPIAVVEATTFKDGDPHLKPNITYYYWVQATDSQGDVSAFSPVAKVVIR